MSAGVAQLAWNTWPVQTGMISVIEDEGHRFTRVIPAKQKEDAQPNTAQKN
jgi:hypothetical protein